MPKSNICLDLTQKSKIAILSDIHGEVSALEKVLKDPLLADHFFLINGDLFDRGPNSPACWVLIDELLKQGRGAALLGNHELNTLLGDEKEGNGWFFNNFDHNEHERQFLPCSILEDDNKQAVLDFIANMPLYAKLPPRKDGKSVVAIHAYYNEKLITQLSQLILKNPNYTWKDIYQYYEKLHEAKYTLTANSVLSKELDLYEETYRVIASKERPDYLSLALKYHYELHMGNPLKVLTAGTFGDLITEKNELFYAGGRWRAADRKKWWKDEVSNTHPCVLFGHYWRKHLPLDFYDEEFSASNSEDWMGPQKRHFCMDYSVGRTFQCRNDSFAVDKNYTPELCVLTWPEEKKLFYKPDL